MSEKCIEFNSSKFYQTGKHNETVRKMWTKSVQVLIIQSELEKVVLNSITQSKSKYKEQVETQFNLINLLFMFEGILTLAINLFTIYIIETEHADLWSYRNNKYVSSIDDLTTVDLFHKIEFLKRHDYGFLEDLYPRSIRNAVAHTNYSINPDGSLVTYNTKGNPQNPIKPESLKNISKNIATFINILAASAP